MTNKNYKIKPVIGKPNESYLLDVKSLSRLFFNEIKMYCIVVAKYGNTAEDHFQVSTIHILKG